MNFIEEMEWRGMLHDMTPGAKEALEKGMCKAYIGFDPTAPSLTIGNYVQLMVLTLFQKSGHQPIVLMGGATGRIGDPSGKDKERQLKSYEELDNNLAHQVKQMEKFLNFQTGENKALLRNNIDFYKDMNILDFLRNVGKTLTVNYMMSKDSVKNRLDTGLSFTEFSYQLLQAYDFQYLYDNDGCQFQMGGSDQWGNITSGTEFIRRNLESAKAYAVTSKLLAKADGKKFGKSEQGNIWLDPNMTSPYQFYQFWLKASNEDLPMFLKYFSLKSRETIEALITQAQEDPQAVTSILSEELTKRIHGDEAFENAKNVSQVIFNKKLDNVALKAMNPETLEMVSKEVPSFELASKETDLSKVLCQDSEVFTSVSEYRRAIKGNALSVNKNKVASHEHNLTEADFIHGKYLMVENGKKNKFMLVVNS